MKKRALLILSLATTLGGYCHASSNEAWSKSQKAIAQSCLQASSLKETRVAGEIVDFDDEAGLSALVIEGRYPQSFMKNRKAKSYACSRARVIKSLSRRLITCSQPQRQ